MRNVPTLTYGIINRAEWGALYDKWEQRGFPLQVVPEKPDFENYDLNGFDLREAKGYDSNTTAR